MKQTPNAQRRTLNAEFSRASEFKIGRSAFGVRRFLPVLE
jgi:hypothetical protein